MRRRTPWLVSALVSAFLLATAGCVPAGDAGRSPTVSPTRSATPSADTNPSARPGDDPCPARATATVSDANELSDALASATAGSVIRLADGVFRGEFVLSARGTPDAPVWVCGSAESILDGGGADGGYVLHLNGVENARIVGFTVRNGQKGIMADRTTGSVFDRLTVKQIGDEGIHLRRGSSGNTIEGSTITETGLRKAQFGEGVYIGSARSNWCELSGCEPDRSDGNVIRGNTIARTTAESVDIKEGTTGGYVLGNHFDGAGISGADSWVDVKGVRWTVTGNEGTNAPLDGFQTHRIVEGWGTDNHFSGNVAHVGAAGYGFHFAPPLGNVLACDNIETGAAKGLSNIDCG